MSTQKTPFVLNSWKLALAAVLGQALSGCSHEVADVAPDSEQLGEVSQALNETAFDRPAAAAIMRRHFGDEELWVFACNSSNQMKRRHKYENYWDQNSQWTAWFTVAGSYSCASQPSVGKWRNPSVAVPPITVPFEALRVYWRDLNNHLIEATYSAQGVNSVTDLSNDLGIGPIAGRPVVVDYTNVVNYTERISVAIMKAGASHELYTLDYYQGSWHVRPILLAGGQTATGVDGASFVASNSAPGNGFNKAYISMQHNAGAHFIYSRTSWTVSYAQYAWTAGPATGAPKGVLSLAGGDHDPPCITSGCAIYRDPATNQAAYAPLATGGDITNSFQLCDPIGQPGPLLGGSIRGRGAMLDEAQYGFFRTSSGHLGIWDYVGANSGDVGGTNLTSAPFPAEETRAQAFYAKGASNTLHHWGDNGHVNLGLNLLPP